MKQFEAQVTWQRAGQAFPDGHCHIANSPKTGVVVMQER